MNDAEKTASETTEIPGQAEFEDSWSSLKADYAAGNVELVEDETKKSSQVVLFRDIAWKDDA